MCRTIAVVRYIILCYIDLRSTCVICVYRTIVIHEPSPSLHNVHVLSSISTKGLSPSFPNAAGLPETTSVDITPQGIIVSFCCNAHIELIGLYIFEQHLKAFQSQS